MKIYCKNVVDKILKNLSDLKFKISILLRHNL